MTIIQFIVYYVVATFLVLSSPLNTLAVSSFDECAKAGYPVMLSYPRQCQAEGKTYFENTDGIPSFGGSASSSTAAGTVEGRRTFRIITLRQGMQNDQVLDLQKRLQKTGYFPTNVKPSRYFGSLTKKAVMKFQKDKSLPVTGIVGPQTRAALAKTERITTIAGSFGETGQPQLKYKLLEKFGDVLFCDPDYYPIPRGDESEIALRIFPGIEGASAEFQEILKHAGLAGVKNFSAEQKLLIYREHKKLNSIFFEPIGPSGGANVDNGYKFNILIKGNPSPGYENKTGERIIGSIDLQGTITVSSRQSDFPNCPICLASNTLIDTPSGPAIVQNLMVGAEIWTTNKSGQRQRAVILQTTKTPVPQNHEVVRVILADGRTLIASPGHPTADGKTIGNLSTGDILDGSYIISAKRIPYQEKFTFDILPSGETGTYWANGVLVKSTTFNK